MLHEVFQIGQNPNTTLTTYLSPSMGLLEKKPLIIVCPGGGFLDCSPNEGECVALHFVRAGYHAAVLIYSNKHTAPDKAAMPQSLFDMADALCLIRAHSDEWGIDPDKIIISGFSAGAQLSALYGNVWNTPLLDGHGTAIQRKPNAVVLGYAPLDDKAVQPKKKESIDMQSVLSNRKNNVKLQALLEMANTALYGHYPPSNEEQRAVCPIYHINAETPPTFLWTTFADVILSPVQSLHYAEALYQQGIPCELHIFDKGEHGISLADRTSAKKAKGIDFHTAHWADLAVEWLDRLFEL